jgi:hypothetical protein
LPDWFLFTLLTFAVYRASQLLVYDDGPFNLIFKFRVMVGVHDLDQGGEPKALLGKLFACPYCLGLWLAIPGALVAAGAIDSFIILWLAIAGSQSFLEALSRHGER